MSGGNGEKHQAKGDAVCACTCVYMRVCWVCLGTSYTEEIRVKHWIWKAVYSKAALRIKPKFLTWGLHYLTLISSV